MNDGIKCVKDNNFWDLFESPEGAKLVGCKSIFKTKKDSKGNVEKYKPRLVAKDFTRINENNPRIT